VPEIKASRRVSWPANGSSGSRPAGSIAGFRIQIAAGGGTIDVSGGLDP